ncbi:MAG: hypothetical protein ABR910_13760 [Acidobacteriaceae bacterium]|jgi:hypothetical protein
METIVVSRIGHAYKGIAGVARSGIRGCDFGDNKDVTNSTFEEADMSS